MSVAGSADAGGGVDVAVVGAGPRGLIVLQQLAQAVADHPVTPRRPLRVLVCERRRPGSGGVWNPEQAPELLMNGTARQSSVYPHPPSDTCSHRYSAGPDLATWLQEQGRAEELDRTDGYASRAAFGAYLEDVFARLLAEAETLDVRLEDGEVVSVDEREHDWELTLLRADGSRVRHGAACVVLATGHTETLQDPTTRDRAEHTHRRDEASAPLWYLPARLDAADGVDAIPPGTPTYLEGLGLGFFDALALLSEHRGGRFEAVPGTGAPSASYVPSGREPSLFAGSRRGLPFLGRSRLFRAAPVSSDALERAFADASTGSRVRFGDALWPAMEEALREVAEAALADLEDSAADEGLRARTSAWVRLPFSSWPDVRSLDGIYEGTDDHESTVAFLRDQVALEALSLQDGVLLDPRQRVAGALAPLRNRLRALVPGLRLQGLSYRDELERFFTPLSSFIATGPPMLRIEQTLALAESGVLTLVGSATAEPSADGFTVRPARNGAPEIPVRALVEARVPAVAADRSSLPLLQALFARGTAAVHTVDGVRLHGVDVTVPEGRVLRPDGTAHTGLFAFGIPTEGIYWNTVAGPISDAEHPIFTSARELAEAALREVLPEELVGSHES